MRLQLALSPTDDSPSHKLLVPLRLLITIERILGLISSDPFPPFFSHSGAPTLIHCKDSMQKLT